jgi:hypothetical protein
LATPLARRPHLARLPQKLLEAVFGALAIRLAVASREKVEAAVAPR